MENSAGSIVTQVRETENFKPDCKWVFLGYYFYNDPLMDDLFENAPIYEGGRKSQQIGKFIFMDCLD